VGVDEARYRALAARSLIEPRTAAEAIGKLQAIDALCKSDMPVPGEKFRQDLLDLLSNPFPSWEGSRVTSMCNRLLELFEPPDVDYPSETPWEPAADDYWHPDARWAEVDQHDSQGIRDAWRGRLTGIPNGPWPRGKDIEADWAEEPEEGDAA